MLLVGNIKNNKEMNITVEKIKRTLEKDYGWEDLRSEENLRYVEHLISDTLKVIDDELIRHKGISIKNTKPKNQKN